MTDSLLFATYNILIVTSDTLTQDESESLMNRLIANGANEESVQIITSSTTLQEYELMRFSHIVANDVNFKSYEACKKLLRAVVKSSWISDSITSSKIQIIKSYSPDPKHIFKDVVVSCSASMSPQDRDLVFEICQILGAITLSHLSPSTTHLVCICSGNDDEQLSILRRYNDVIEEGQRAIIPVFPSWVFECFNSRKRLDETEFTISPEKSYSLIQSQHKSKKQDILQGKEFYISETYSELNSVSKTYLRQIIESNGGQVNLEITPNTDCYICQYRSGDEYFDGLKKLRKGQLTIGNLPWLISVLHNEEYVDSLSSSLLHFPYPKEPLASMKDLTISLTNYTGDSRTYIEKLVKILGAKFTRSLGPNNTHLITCSLVGRKYLAADKWDFKTVNHLWIEDTYSKWLPQDVNKDRYTHFVEGSLTDKDLILGATKLDLNMISDTRSLQTQPTQFSQTVNASIKDTLDEDKENDPVNNQESDQWQEAQQEEDNDMEVDSAKDQFEENGKRRRSSTTKPESLGQRSINSMPSSPTISQPKPQKKQKNATTAAVVAAPASTNKSSSNIEQPVSPTPIPANNGKPYNVIAIITGYDSDISKNDLKILNKVGIKIIDQPSPEMNCIIAPSILRTEKFLKSLSMGLDYILTPLFLSDVLGTMDSYNNKISEFNSYKPDIKRYSLSNTIDLKNENKKIKELFLDSKLGKVNIINLIAQSKVKQKSLFKGIYFNISSEIQGTPQLIGGILESFGCEGYDVLDCDSKSLNLTDLKEKGLEECYYLVCSPSHKNLIQSFKKSMNIHNHKYRIVEWDWIVRCVFNMQVIQSTDANSKKFVIYESK